MTNTRTEDDEDKARHDEVSSRLSNLGLSSLSESFAENLVSLNHDKDFEEFFDSVKEWEPDFFKVRLRELQQD